VESKMADLVRLKCVKEGSRLRIKIISGGYSPDANCQFPKAIRAEGREYTAPASDVSLCDTRGKFFYRVKKNNIVVVVGGNAPGAQIDISNLKVYGDENMAECAICMNDTTIKPDIVFVILAPCGHYCSCNECAIKLKNCPMCRANIGQIVTREQLQ
jgi:hypothetical protein